MSPRWLEPGHSVQLPPIDTHELILEVYFWKPSLTSMTLEVAAVAMITDISETFIVHTGEPFSVVEEAHTLSEGKAFEPPSDVTVEFIIEFVPVVKICGSHGCFYQVVKKSPDWPADTADKVRFPHQGEDSALSG